MINERKAIEQLQMFTVFRHAQSTDPQEYIAQLRTAAGFSEQDYLDAPLDKAGLSALASQLNPGAQTKV